MKREAKLLLEKACDALVLSIELFNRPHDRGRISGTLIQLDHGFEMLLKAAILHRGGSIREKRAKQTIGFDVCVRRALSDGQIKFLTEEQALVLQTLNGLRDAAQHHLLEISEGQLYVHIQSGVTLFRDLLKSVFQQELVSHLPERVLPVSTTPPTDLATLFDSEISEIKKLLRPGKRRQVEALARLRPLAILDGTIRGEKGQPSDADLRRLGTEVLGGKNWGDVFQGVAAVDITTEGTGPSFALRITKKEGPGFHLVKEGTPGATVIAVKRVDDRGYYNLSATALAKKVGLTRPKTIAVVDYLGLREKKDCYKVFEFGKSTHPCYSQKAIDEILACLKIKSADEIWAERRGGKAKRTGSREAS